MLSIGSECVLDSWPHHEWKQAKDASRQTNEKGPQRLQVGSECVLDSWPHHEWKQPKDLPQKRNIKKHQPLLIGSECMLDSWPHHEWKQAKDLPQQRDDEGLEHLLDRPQQSDCVLGADCSRDDRSDVSRGGSVGDRMVSRLGAVFSRRH